MIIYYHYIVKFIKEDGAIDIKALDKTLYNKPGDNVPEKQLHLHPVLTFDEFKWQACRCMVLIGNVKIAFLNV